MPKGIPIDLGTLHAVLWAESDRLGRVKIVQKDLAAQLGITKFTMSRVMTRMVQEARLRQISKTKHLDGVFLVIDPAVWP